MKPSSLLISTSMLSIVFSTLHFADDIARGIEPGTATNLIGIPIFVAWLYGTLALRGRRSGYVAMFLGGVFAAAMPVVHMQGQGVGGEFAKSNGSFWFIWTIIALGITGVFTSILAARATWNPSWASQRIPK